MHSIYVVQLPPGPIWALHSLLCRHVGTDARLAPRVRQPLLPRTRQHILFRQVTMTTEHIDTAIILGAGQAGLSTAYHLRQRGRPCLILDANKEVGDNWRAQWDSLRLYSPAVSDSLPGMPFPGPRVGPSNQGSGRPLSGCVRQAIRPPGPNARPRRPAGSRGREVRALARR